MEELKKKKKFNLYNFLNEGNNNKGVKKDEDRTPSFLNFFKFFGRNLGNLVKLNLLFLLANFPLFFSLFALSGYAGKSTTAPASTLFAVLHPLATSGEANPIVASLYGVTGIQGTMLVNTTLTWVFYGLGLLVIFTFGLANVGIAYNMRNIVRCEPVFLLSDFWDAVRKNVKQGILMGILDIVIVAALFFDIVFYGGSMRIIALVILLLYLLMRFYIYILIPTFKLSLFKVFKNSMIFILLNIKRNMAAILGIAVVLFLNYALFVVFPPLGMLMPLALTISACMFIGVYAAWPSIKTIMVDPYEEEQDEQREKPIFEDRG